MEPKTTMHPSKLYQSEQNQTDVIEKIKVLKTTLGKDLLILTHHYQRKEIVDLGDYVGDSFALSKKAAQDEDARYIVFCGVHFMAESAAILARPHQTVQIPDIDAGCWMADMLDHEMAENALQEAKNAIGDSVIPVVYVNSDAKIKAFCGRNGGITCTSSNVSKAFRWAFEQQAKIFFFPDQHLGRNTGVSLDMDEKEMLVWQTGKPLGGHTLEALRASKIMLWDGYCLVHTRFKVDHIKKMRQDHPEAKIVVHPECPKEVVQASDAVGSTSFIVQYVQSAPGGSTIAIGTEINLIKRLAIEHPDKTILALYESLCPNMYKINLFNLLETLENIGRSNVITVPEDIKADAKKALDRMLHL
ncbi:MAG: quinolinate synthase [Desulfobacterium sp.]|nr:quinolinate synthase [Desulfobacterium sp.]